VLFQFACTPRSVDGLCALPISQHPALYPLAPLCALPVNNAPATIMLAYGQDSVWSGLEWLTRMNDRTEWLTRLDGWPDCKLHIVQESQLFSLPGLPHKTVLDIWSGHQAADRASKHSKAAALQGELAVHACDTSCGHGACHYLPQWCMPHFLSAALPMLHLHAYHLETARAAPGLL